MNINPDWNTPPGGDFARYVERLSQQRAASLRTESAAQRLDEFPGEPAAPAAGRLPRAKSPAAGVAPRPVGGLARAVLGVGVVLLAVLHFVFNASAFVLLVVAAALGWTWFMLRRVLSSETTAMLRQRLEQAAREARLKGKQ